MNDTSSQENRGTFLVKGLLLVLLVMAVSCIGISISLWVSGYNTIVTFLLTQLNAAQYEVQFRTQYFTPTLFTILAPLMLLAGVASAGGSYLAFRNTISLTLFTNRIATSAKETIRHFLFPAIQVSAIEKALFVLIVAYILGTRIMLSGITPFHIDEMHSWLYFIDKGPLVSLSYYPSPNNHVLFSLLCCVTDIFTNEPMLLMRITSIAIGMCCSLLVFRFLLSYTGFSMAVLGMLLFSFTPAVQHYSVLARGYMLETVFFIFAFWAFIRLIQQPASNKFQWIFVLSSAAGAFTLITFLYASVGFGCIGLYYYFKQQKTVVWIKINAILLACILLLYTPLMLFSGIGALTQNSWILRPSWAEYMSTLSDIYANHSSYFTGFESWSGWILPLLLLFPIFYLRNTLYFRIVSIGFTVLMISLSICLLQQIVPYERMWTHFIFTQQIALLFCISDFTSSFTKYSKALSVGLILLVAFSFPITLAYQHRSRPDVYNDAGNISRKIMDEHPTEIYCEEYVYYNYLMVEARKNELKTRISNENIQQPEFVLLLPGNPWPVSLDQSRYRNWKSCDSFVCIFRFKH